MLPPSTVYDLYSFQLLGQVLIFFYAGYFGNNDVKGSYGGMDTHIITFLRYVTQNVDVCKLYCITPNLCSIKFHKMSHFHCKINSSTPHNFCYSTHGGPFLCSKACN